MVTWRGGVAATAHNRTEETVCVCVCVCVRKTRQADLDGEVGAVLKSDGYWNLAAGPGRGEAVDEGGWVFQVVLDQVIERVGGRHRVRGGLREREGERERCSKILCRRWWIHTYLTKDSHRLRKTNRGHVMTI